VSNERALEKRSILPSKLRDFTFKRLEIYGFSFTVRPTIDRQNSNQDKAFEKQLPDSLLGSPNLFATSLIRLISMILHGAKWRMWGSCLLDV
jgi:hypothetical protein